MLVTVVTVTYNAVHTIEKTLLSVIGQSYSDIEYLIIDGGSSDGTIEIIRKFSQRVNKVISEPDQGIYDAMNKALTLAQGDFLIFMNAGDKFYSSDVIKNFISKIDKKEAVYYGDACFIDAVKNESFVRGGEFTGLRLAKENICHQTIFYPKRVYKNFHYKCKYRLLADWHYNLKIYRKYPFIFLNQIIAFYDTNGLSNTHQDFAFEKRQKLMILRYLGLKVFMILVLRKFIFKK